MEFYSNEDIRCIIHNAHKIKEFNKCQNCNGTGFENWNGETGGDVKPGPLSTTDGFERDWGECERCEGIGYIDILMYPA